MDDIDYINERTQADEENAISEARKRAALIPIGAPGECEYCGFEFERLVGGACGRCRDEFKLN